MNRKTIDIIDKTLLPTMAILHLRESAILKTQSNLLTLVAI